jgi:hypothetical protein
MKQFLAVILLFVSAGSAEAATGTPYGMRTVPSLFFGPSGTSFFLPENPADAPRFDADLRGSVSFLLERSSGFSAPVSEYNNSWSAALDAAEVSWSPARYIRIGAGTLPFASFEYSARRTTGDETRTFESSGEIRSIHASVFAVRPGSLFAGTIVRLLAGRSSVRSGLVSSSDPSLDSSSTSSDSYLGFRTEILAGWEITKAFGLSAFFAPPGRLTKDKTTVRTLPIETGLRLDATSAINGKFDAGFFGEAVYANGRGFTEKNGSADAFTPSSFRDTLSFLAGCSFAAGRDKSLRFRTGWGWMPVMDDRYSDRQTVFFGGTFPFAKDWSASCDAVWTLRPYRGDGVFFDADSSVQQNVFSVSAGVSYAVR